MIEFFPQVPRRPFPVAVVAADDEGPCPRILHERAREAAFIPYRLAAQKIRNLRAEAFNLAALRRETRNPAVWLKALAQSVDVRAELYFAHREKAAVARFLPEPLQHEVVCAAAPGPRPPLWRVATAFAASAGLAFTPVKLDQIPLTPELQLEYAQGIAFCGEGSGRPKQGLCHAPKTALERRRTGTGNSPLASA